MSDIELHVIDDTDNEDSDEGIGGWVVSTSDNAEDTLSYVARFNTMAMAEWFARCVPSMEGVPLNDE